MRQAVAALTTAAVWLVLAASTLAASPSPGAEAGDPRSAGQGPGLVGDPLTAVFAVLAIGAFAVVATLVYVRLTNRPDA
jgi:hypothetical protein